MKRFLLLLALMAALVCHAQTLSGTWRGKLQAGLQQLTLVLHIDATGKAVKMDVVEQGAMGVPMVVDVLSADSLNASVPALGVNIAGKSVVGKLECTFRQGIFTAKMAFERGKVQFNRPQEPKPPYHYTTQEIKFQTPSGAAVLAGTLTYPTTYKPGQRVPVVLMVTGSGPQNRDEELFGHKYFLVIADWLAHNGIASLRYDDRGVGQSTGDFKASTTADFAEDAASGLAYLKGKKVFSKVGILGHSEGGAIAYLLGAKGLPDFIVSLSGPAGRIDSLMLAQTNGLARAQGAPSDVATTVKEVRSLLLTQDSGAWMRYFLDMDLTPAVRNTHCPVLALGGEKDLNVPVSLNNKVLRANLPPTKGNLIKVYPGLGHTFQPAKTGIMTECSGVEETFSTEVLKDITAWIKSIL